MSVRTNQIAAKIRNRRIPPPECALQAAIAPGELLDKITILEIKSERMADAEKLRRVRHELAVLRVTWDRVAQSTEELATVARDLRQVNEALWDVEDELRVCEREQQLGERFIERARSVSRHNDRRAALKRRINELLGSSLIEEKSYAPYAPAKPNGSADDVATPSPPLLTSGFPDCPRPGGSPG
jgi:hypothetical protein